MGNASSTIEPEGPWPAGLLTEDLDLPRMRRQRHDRLRRQLERHGVDALLLTGSGAVQYAAGPDLAAGDAGRAVQQRTTALVVAGDPEPHLLTPDPAAAPPELAGDHVHPAMYLESAAGAEDAVTRIADLVGGPIGRLATDDLSMPLFQALTRRLDGTDLVDAARLLGPARVVKTPDELRCIRGAQQRNELAMYDVQRTLRPGVRQTDLTGTLLQGVFDRGATANAIDPIWQVMPERRADGPFTTNDDIAFPLVTTGRRFEEGDVVWVDSGVQFHGYASDFGRTWIVGDRPRPTDRQRGQFDRWRQVVLAVLDQVRPGASGADLTAAARRAAGGATPWLSHFYLVHGLGTESAEAPMIGTDAGPDADERLTLAPGMVLVIEPVIWDDGAAGYRAEDIVAVTDDGWVALSDYPYDPYGL